MPFGNPDFFIYYFLIIGFFTFLRKSLLYQEKYRFKPLSLLALLFFAGPLYFHVIGKGLTFLPIYSLIFTLVPAAAILTAPYCTKILSLKLIVISVIMSAVFDMLIYFRFTGWNIPHNLNYLLLPYSFLLFTSGVIRREREAVNG